MPIVLYSKQYCTSTVQYENTVVNDNNSERNTVDFDHVIPPDEFPPPFETSFADEVTTSYQSLHNIAPF